VNHASTVFVVFKIALLFVVLRCPLYRSDGVVLCTVLECLKLVFGKICFLCDMFELFVPSASLSLVYGNCLPSIVT
jgi:hypothetical protein